MTVILSLWKELTGKEFKILRSQFGTTKFQLIDELRKDKQQKPTKRKPISFKIDNMEIILKMKIGIIIFISLLITSLVNCSRFIDTKSNSQKLDSTAVSDKYLQSELKSDSFELLQVFHCQSDTYHVEQIIFLDKRFHTQTKKYWVENLSKIKNGNCENCFMNKNTKSINITPNNILSFADVKYFNKQLTLAEACFKVYLINDSFIAFEDMVQTTFYKFNTLVKKNGYQKLAFSDDTLEIVNYENDLQLWKSKSNKISLKTNLSSALKLPIIYSRNNLGEGAECFEINFDKTNLDSLFSIYSSKVVKE
ncbi:MAG: hypothetical protein RIQ33_740 [Bacteroidota bacterium]|jgi:hypothetical protein